jgi:hypothetical protein
MLSGVTRAGRWWETELPAIEKHLRRDLFYRYPALVADHDDVVNKTLLRVTEVMRGAQADFPEDQAIARLHAFAKVIARNFAMDLVRRFVRERRAPVDPEVALSTVEDERPGPDRRVDMAMALDTVLEVLAKASTEDRELFVRMVEGSDEPAMTPRQRQRALRLRTEMAKKLEARFGSDLLSALRSEMPSTAPASQKRPPADRTIVGIEDDAELRFWCDHFGCTRPELLTCVARVGSHAADVRRCLGK